jgi:hypothetical protein
MVAGAGDLVSDKQQPTLNVEGSTAGADVEEQPVTPPVDHPPVEDLAAGASISQNEQPAELPVEQPAAGANVEEQRIQQRVRAWCRGMSS